jgi:hypothetical protein
MNQMTQLMQQCIANCTECHRICTETLAHLLHGGGHHSESKHLIAMLDCAQMCGLCADFMTRHSPHHGHVCPECAEICTACAALCEAHTDSDGQMRRCAEACRRCATSCAAMGESMS